MSIYTDKENVTSKKRNIEFDEGKHHRAKLGFILMSTDLAGESDFFDMAPKDIGIHITRLKTDDFTTNETLSRHIDFMADAASRIQPDVKPNVISYSCTSGSIVIGEERIMSEINGILKKRFLPITPTNAIFLCSDSSNMQHMR